MAAAADAAAAIAALAHEHRAAILLILFAGVCYWAFLPALRRRREHRRGNGRGA